jgi:hypothetical protein
VYIWLTSSHYAKYTLDRSQLMVPHIGGKLSQIHAMWVVSSALLKSMHN